MKDLKEYLSKKLGAPEKKPNELKQKAKANVLNDFKDAAKEHMAEGMGSSLKKVTVMAKDDKDLEKGLDMAKKIAHNKELPKDEEQPSKLADMLMGHKEEDEDPAEEAMETGPEEEAEESEDKDSKIASLEAQLAKMQEMISKLKA